MSQFEELKERLVHFRDERDWGQFHTVKNLMNAISIEAGELQELVLWKTDEEVSELMKDPEFSKELHSECADILNFLIMMSHVADFDIVEAAQKKIDENDKRYPVAKAKGTSKKYTEL
jgi:NTP pyrophosphatase (non-canonical NTP hydrolase)